MTRPLEKPFVVRSPHYLEWIHGFPCLVCRTSTGESDRAKNWQGHFERRIEAAHIGPHGLSSKASDTMVLPLCNYHHQHPSRGLGALGMSGFESMYRIDLYEKCLLYLTRFIFEGNQF